MEGERGGGQGREAQSVEEEGKGVVGGERAGKGGTSKERGGERRWGGKEGATSGGGTGRGRWSGAAHPPGDRLEEAELHEDCAGRQAEGVLCPEVTRPPLPRLSSLPPPRPPLLCGASTPLPEAVEVLDTLSVEDGLSPPALVVPEFSRPHLVC